jgi:hypothetical protein
MITHCSALSYTRSKAGIIPSWLALIDPKLSEKTASIGKFCSACCKLIIANKKGMNGNADRICKLDTREMEDHRDKAGQQQSHAHDRHYIADERKPGRDHVRAFDHHHEVVDDHVKEFAVEDIDHLVVQECEVDVAPDKCAIHEMRVHEEIGEKVEQNVYVNRCAI